MPTQVWETVLPRRHNLTTTRRIHKYVYSVCMYIRIHTTFAVGYFSLKKDNNKKATGCIIKYTRKMYLDFD